MKPIASGKANGRLLSITFAACENRSTPDIPIVIEDDAFVSMWLPSIRDRLRLAFGAPVRVLVNYSVHGSLHVDAAGDWGISSLGDG